MTVASSATTGAASRTDDAIRLHGVWLTLARLFVLAFGLVFLVLFIIGVPVRFEALTTVCPSAEDCPALFLSGLEVAALPAWLSIEAYAVYQIALEVVLLTVSMSVAALILYRRSDTLVGLLAATVAIDIGTTVANVIATLGEAVPLVAAIYWPMSLLGIWLFWVFALVFPDGRIEPPWLRWRFPAILIASFLSFAWIYFLPEGLVSFGIFVVWLFTPILAQVIRYRRYTSPAQRQQVKWGLVGMAALVIGVPLWLTMEPAISPFPNGAPRLTWNLVGMPFTIVAAGMLPVTLAYSILRHRLWDIDRVINRALVYGTLTVTLTGIYVGTIVLVQQFILSGQNSPLVVAGSTLLIAALFAPLRQRIQAFIDRRFYRHKYDSQQALAAFAATARAQVDLDALTAELLRVVGDTVQPQRVGVWLKPDPKPSRTAESPSRTAS